MRNRAGHGEAELKAQITHDYSSSDDGIVPLDARRGTWSHHVPLWITLYAGFSYMALGSELYAFGFTLHRMLLVVSISSVCYLLYAAPAAYLGAYRGQTHALMSRSVFGLTGSMIVSAFVLIAPLGWIGYQSNTLSVIWNSLYGWVPVVGIGVVIAVLNITNNVLGFTGITAFARWVAGPATVVWVVWMVVKALTQTGGTVLNSHLAGVPRRYRWASSPRSALPPMATSRTCFATPSPVGRQSFHRWPPA